MKLSYLWPTYCATSFVSLLALSGTDAASLTERDLAWRDSSYCREHQPCHTDTAIPTAAPKRWVHPGVFVDREQLDYVSHKVKEGAQPWSNAFTSMLAYNLSTPTRTANPRAVVECGPTSTPNLGCYDEREDSMAAYINALAWWITKSQKYADKAIYYMNSWSGVLQAHNNSNAPLQAAWSAANWVRAGEIIKSSNSGWKRRGVEAFEKMLTDVYLPIIIGGNTQQNGNWELGMRHIRLC